MTHPRIAKITIGEAQGAQEKHLQEPVKNDGDFAQKERALNIRRHRRAMNVGRDKNIVEHHKSEGQHRRHTQNIQRVRQRNETPFGCGQIEGVADHHTECDEIGQDAQQQRQTIEKRVTLETQIETRQHRKRSRQRVVRRNQGVAQGQI